jgi:hypothetical protein
VFADLKPYICTFPVCKNELVKFPTRKLWADHEFNEHRVVRSWVCSQCPEKFLSPGDWGAHLTYMHRTAFSGLPFQFALAAAERRHPQPIKDQKCPLCLDTPASKRRNFEAHVGRHMEEIALAALPREIEEPGLEDGSLARISNEEFEKSIGWVKEGRDSKGESVSDSTESAIYDPSLLVDSPVALELPLLHKPNCKERNQRVEKEVEKDKEEAKGKQKLEGIREDGSYNPLDPQRHQQIHQRGHLELSNQAQISRHLVEPRVAPLRIPAGWSCSRCHKAFVDRSNCARHIKSHHGNGYSFRCERCSRVFARLENFRIHISKKSCADETILSGFDTTGVT